MTDVCQTCNGRGWVDDVEGLWFLTDWYNNCPRCAGSGKDVRTVNTEI